jgi:hypothetical protein
MTIGAVLAMMFVIFSQASPAAACSCIQTTEAESFASHDVVFVGEVTERVPPENQGPVTSSAAEETWRFTVSRVFKGEAAVETEVRTAQDGAACGLELHGRGPFLVLASEEDGPGGGLTSNLCSGSRPVVDAPVPDTFGAGRAPEAADPPPPAAPSPDAGPPSTSGSATSSTADSGSSGVGWPAVGVAAVAIGSVAVAFALVRRRRRLAPLG